MDFDERIEEIIQQYRDKIGSIKEGTPLFKLSIPYNTDIVQMNRITQELDAKVKELIPNAVIITVPSEDYDFELVPNKSTEDKIKELEQRIKVLENNSKESE